MDASCPSCGYAWTYGGSLRYATCPQCKSKVTLYRADIMRSHSRPGRTMVDVPCEVLCRCGKQWMYRGKNRVTATCPKCKTSVTLHSCIVPVVEA